MRVRDDGKGIDQTVLAAQGVEGHYGLRGMPERAALIGGNWRCGAKSVQAPRWSCGFQPAPSMRQRGGAPGGHDCLPPACRQQDRGDAR